MPIAKSTKKITFCFIELYYVLVATNIFCKDTENIHNHKVAHLTLTLFNAAVFTLFIHQLSFSPPSISITLHYPIWLPLQPTSLLSTFGLPIFPLVSLKEIVPISFFFVSLQIIYAVQLFRIYNLSACRFRLLLASAQTAPLAKHLCRSGILPLLWLVGLAFPTAHCFHLFLQLFFRHRNPSCAKPHFLLPFPSSLCQVFPLGKYYPQSTHPRLVQILRLLCAIVCRPLLWRTIRLHSPSSRSACGHFFLHLPGTEL